MKTLLGTTFLMLCCMNTIASPYNTGYDYEEDACRSMMDLADSVMTARQNGMPIIKSFESMYELTSNPAEKFVNQKMYDMIISAYGANIYETEKAKSVAISGFSAKYYLECADELGL